MQHTVTLGTSNGGAVCAVVQFPGSGGTGTPEIIRVFVVQPNGEIVDVDTPVEGFRRLAVLANQEADEDPLGVGTGSSDPSPSGGPGPR